MERTINAPDKDWMNEKEAADFLGVGEALLRAMVKKGFVIERRLNQKHRKYHWKALVIALWRIELGDLPENIPEDREE